MKSFPSLDLLSKNFPLLTFILFPFSFRIKHAADDDVWLGTLTNVAICSFSSPSFINYLSALTHDLLCFMVFKCSSFMQITFRANLAPAVVRERGEIFLCNFLSLLSALASHKKLLVLCPTTRNWNFSHSACCKHFQLPSRPLCVNNFLKDCHNELIWEKFLHEEQRTFVWGWINIDFTVCILNWNSHEHVNERNFA